MPQAAKPFLLVLFCVLLAHVSLANSIDSLRSDKDVVRFLINVNSSFKRHGVINIEILSADSLIKQLGCTDTAAKWNIKSWERADFNGDKNSDLLVTVRVSGSLYIYVVMDQGNNRFMMLLISRASFFQDCQLAKPKMIEGKQMLVYHTIKARQEQGKQIFETVETPETDTLVYRYGNFIEFNSAQANYSIESVEINTSGCFGTCPVFNLKLLEKNGEALYHAYMYNPKNGDFEAKIPPYEVKQIDQLIQYINIKMLEDSYRVPWTDDQTAILKIKFTDGSIKEISDYGMAGTFGLSRLYALLSELRITSKWQKIK